MYKKSHKFAPRVTLIDVQKIGSVIIIFVLETLEVLSVCDDWMKEYCWKKILNILNSINYFILFFIFKEIETLHEMLSQYQEILVHYNQIKGAS